ncbi:MAG: T9SS type A sorting domain-containing protein, partial [Bacteroidetes bacterium]|nr:T9SS type A sorting domain-containing protein [Bacteroidota bacterium]
GGNHNIFNAGEYDIFCASLDFSLTQIYYTQLFPEIMVYPNPAHERIWLRCSEIHNGPLNIKIFNSSGMEINSEKLTLADGQYSLDIRNLNPGIYFIFLKTEGNISGTKKIAVY